MSTMPDMPAGASAALDETLAYLASDEAIAAIELDPYWPKWESPLWRMVLLRELGLAARIPERAIRKEIDVLNRRCLHTFPFRIEDVPPGVDPVRDVPCHCQLGTVALLVRACGLDWDAELPWVRPWILRYQLEDGGLNCDEAAYVRPTPRSSIVSTVAAAEAILEGTDRPFTGEEGRLLSRAAGYLSKRRLARSVSKGFALVSEAWLTPCFPRFYEYDILRGLRFLARYAVRTGEPIEAEAIAEARAHLEALVSGGAGALAPRRIYEGSRSFRRDETGTWRRGAPALSFPLLDLASRHPEMGRAILRAEWLEVHEILSRPGVVGGAGVNAAPAGTR